ncbi:MAG: site-specific integrase, partial [Gemmatimonas sp.]
MSDTPEAAPLPTEIGEFLTHLAKERDLSANTVSAYTRDLTEFSTWLAHTHGIGGWDWNELSRTSIRGYMAHLTRRGLAG